MRLADLNIGDKFTLRGRPEAGQFVRTETEYTPVRNLIKSNARNRDGNPVKLSWNTPVVKTGTDDNRGGKRENAGRLGETARLKTGDLLSGKWEFEGGERSLERFEVVEANRRRIVLKSGEGAILRLIR